MPEFKNPLMNEEMTEGADVVRLGVISTGMFELFTPPLLQALWVVVAGVVLWQIRDRA